MGSNLLPSAYNYHHRAPHMPPQGHGESETTGAKLLNIGFKAVLDIIDLIAQAEFNDNNSHTLVTSFSMSDASSQLVISVHLLMALKGLNREA